MSLDHPAIFSILGVPITATVVATSAMVAVLCLLGAVAGRRVQQEPPPWQAIVEWTLDSIGSLLYEMTGTEDSIYLPLVASLGLFILTANLMGVLPFVEAPTADINTPVALAGIVFFSVHYFGIRQAGWCGYLRAFARPSIVLLPMNVLSHLTRTFSLAIRLFGNMLSHQIVVAVLLLILPLIVPAVLQVFGLLISVLQAYIFTILAIVYLGGAVRSEGGAL